MAGSCGGSRPELRASGGGLLQRGAAAAASFSRWVGGGSDATATRLEQGRLQRRKLGEREGAVLEERWNMEQAEDN